MGIGVKIVALFVFLSVIYVIGSLIFAKGFLLKRVVIEKNSSCHADFAEYFDGHGGEGCWLHRRFNKAIIIIIDALRFDFMVPLTQSDAGDKPYLNKLGSISSLLSGRPQNARLYKFIADPPTTTLQRLKGLTTGSLPTFVDAGSNFASSEISEDNVIDQLVKKGKEIVFMGDDTWTSLFPGRFSREYSYPSFNVKDLHTVDNGILDHLYIELRKPDWDVMIVHFLGVDHCGHRYGPNHPAMAEKLTQMDDVIRNITRRMKDDTVLFVLGDHGMTSTGDHGGDSRDEVTAGLFVYSPQQITSSKYTQGEYKTVSQTDLVPTLSLLLGTPIPFSNLGCIITDLLNFCSWTKDSHIKQVFHSVQALRLNAQQISLYLEAYIQTASDFSHERFIQLQDFLSSTEQELQDIVTEMFTQGHMENAHEKLHALEKQYLHFIDSVRTMCQDVWAKFDMTSILLGLLTFSVAIMVNVHIVTMETAVAKEQGFGSALIVVLMSAFYIGYAVFQTLYLESGKMAFMAFMLGIIDLGVVFVAMHILKKRNNKESHSQMRKSKWKLTDLPFEKIASYFVATCSVFALFSNSYVVYDSSVTSFFAQTMVWIMCVRNVQFFFCEKTSLKEHTGRKSRSSDAAFDLMRILLHPVSITVFLTVACNSCIRLSKNFQSCREEQVNCTMTMFLYPLTNLSDTVDGSRNIRYFLSIACLFLSVYLTRSWLKRYGNINSSSPAIICVRYLFPVIAVCCAAHWALQGLPQKVLDSLPVFQQIIFPQAVYFLVLISTVAIVTTPLLIYVLTENKEVSIPAINTSSNLVQKVYNHVKLNWKDHFPDGSQEKTEKPPVVYGLATVYSAGIVYIVTMTILLLSLLLGDGVAPSLLLAILTAFFFLELFTIRCRWSKDKSVSELLLPGVLTISLLSSVFFYATGHHATIPSIRFEAAFIGFVGDFEYKAFPATLIHLNMFAAEVFFTVVSPLLILWPLTRGIISPFVLHRKGESNSQWKGDFSMFEEKNQFRSLLLKLFSLLFLVNSLKLFCALCAAAIHRRHLMVWKIFAPRFVFTAMSSFTVFGVSILVLLFLLQVDSRLEHWVLKLNKQ